jgi:hypothetical protein
MKKLGLLVILVFSVSAIVCAQANNGTFTLTGIPSQYNGKYVFIVGECRAGELLGCVSYNIETEDITLPRISNGRVSIPMWLYNDSTDSLSRYSGNHTAEIEIIIFTSANANDPNSDMIAGIYFEAVVFSNGNATKSWREAEDFWED